MQISDLFDEFPIDGGDVIPITVQKLLREDLNVCDDWQRTEELLLSAQKLMPDRLEINVALYKMYAYSNRHREALELIDETLQRSAERAGFPPAWQGLNQGSAPWHEATGDVRLYLYTLKAMGFVLLRMGSVEQAAVVLHKLEELDPLDQVGGSVVRQMAERLLESEAEAQL